MAAITLAATVTLPAHADPLEQLRTFLTQTQSARGDFSQKQDPKPGARTQPPSQGSFEFQRPGRFRWIYAKPYQQTIVSDGVRLFFYDPDLNQVTVKQLRGALPASPASILFGSNDFERDFQVRADGARDGIEWVLAQPHTTDSPYERIRIGFRDGLPAAMELVDAFGQTTQLAFARLQRNPALAVDTFKFQPPKGADVLEDR